MKIVIEEELLECQICWESFNLVEHIPHVLFCGHTLCRNCTLALLWATYKLQTLPIRLPLFISCPWCQMLSLRLVWKGVLRYPRKNYFLLWLVESVNGNPMRSSSSMCADHKVNSSENLPPRNELPLPPLERLEHSPRRAMSYLELWWFQASLGKLMLFVQITAKLPIVLIFLLVVLYVIPASAAILVVYLLITFLFALPCFLVLYFSYPTLEWLLGEIVS